MPIHASDVGDSFHSLTAARFVAHGLAPDKSQLSLKDDKEKLGALGSISTHKQVGAPARPSGQTKLQTRLVANNSDHDDLLSSYWSDAIITGQPTVPSSESPELVVPYLQASKSQIHKKAMNAPQGAAPACLYALDGSAQGSFSISGSTSISTSCSAVVESTGSQAFQMSGTEILYVQNNAQVGVAGGWNLSGQTKIVNQSTGQIVQPVKISSPGDPLAFLPVPTGGTIIGKSHTSYDMNNKPPNNTLSAGIYCGGLTVGNTNGVTFTMSPGTYVMAGGGLTINSLGIVSGSGVTVYNTSSTGWGCSGSSSYTPITISGQANVTMSAPTTGALADIVLFGDRAGCSQVGSCQDQINGSSTTTLNGAMYFKSDTLLFTGSSSNGCMMAVADKININGNSSFAITGCSGTMGGVTVSVAPTTATLYGGQTQQFSATVTNASSTGVTWSISPSVGTVSSSGLYTAPTSVTSQQSVTVTATSQAEPTVSASATVTLMPSVGVSIAPTAATLYGGKNQQFSATVSNTSNTAVTWSISPSTGTISSSGLYSAPASITSQQTVTVKATSQADATKSATATVTLMPPVSVSISPTSASLYPGQTQQFTATVSNTSNTAVNWTVSPSGVGTVNASGLYTAPASITKQQVVTVTATSQADTTKSASATVTINVPLPSITSITSPAAPGSQITITGQNFLSATGTVTLNGVSVPTNSWSNTSILLTVPSNNCTGPVTVTTQYGTSNAVTLTITGTQVGCLYPPPVANAGPAQTVAIGATVQLDGTGSTDSTGTLLTYSWSFLSIPSGSRATLSSSTASKPTFIADVYGNYKVQLVVNDSYHNSSPSQVVISTQDSAPVANAGPNQTVPTQTLVQLNGSGSTDVDGLPLTYSWSFTSVPAGSKAALSNPTSVNPTFTTDKKGTYVVQLIVNDGILNSAPSTVTISDVNSPPVANAGPNQTVNVGATVQLTGAGSTDVDSDPLTYHWSFTSIPTGSSATLSNATIVNPTFVADVPGNFVVQLIVNDGTVNSTPSTVTIGNQDIAPVANAGPAQTVSLGALVTLDGTKSTDSDNKPLTYQWSLLSVPTGSAAALALPTSPNPYFTADLAGNYVAQLIVNDGYLNSSPSTVTISTSHSVPVANPGPNQTVTVGATVQLSGAASSDVDGYPLTYKWAILSQPTGGTGALSSTTLINPTFVANAGGTYVVQLIVNDGVYSSPPATVTITANPPNQPPVVNAGPNQSITLPVNSVMLNGTATDDGLPNGTLIITWTVVSGPGTVTFSSPNTAVTKATFSAAGTYVLQLSANDSQYTTTSQTTVTVNPPVNQPPVVNAGPNQTVTLPVNTVTLNGTATDDGLPNGTLIITWSVVSGPGTVTFSSSSTAVTNATFSAAGTYVLQLTANDTQLSSSSQATVVVKPAPVNQPPVVSAGPNQAIILPVSTVTLSGTATDDGLPNGTLIVGWSEISGPTSVTFSSPNAAVTQARFTAPGAYVLQLSASDSQYTTTSQVTVYVYASGSNGKNEPPYVSAGPDQTIVLPAPVLLNGVAVDDGLPNGTLVTSWSVVSGPGTVTFSNASSAVTTASFSMAGTYVLQLAANDSALVSTSNVTITAGKLDGHGGYKGTDFWLMFPMNADNCPSCSGNSPFQFQPQLLITSDVNNSGTVTVPGMNFSANFTLTAGQATAVQIPTSAVLNTIDTVENKGIRVTAQSEVTVVGLSYYTASTDGYLGLPTPVLGKNYIVMAYPDAYWGSQLGIVAAYDGTTVTITPTVTVKGRPAGQPYNVILNQGRTYELMTSNNSDDLTGSIITSDKPIAVFGGNQCANIPDANWRYCNHIIEEMLPTDLWGQNFLTVPFPNQVNGDIIRILAAQNGTNVSINGLPVATLNVGQFYQTFETSAASINADGPVLVAQFETSEEYQTHSPFGGPPNGTFLGDPSMTLVPANEQFGGHYTVLTPTTGFQANYVDIVAPTASLSGLMMDGAPLSANFAAIPGSTYSGAQVPVATGVHHFDGTSPFGVTLYGADAYDAYSYQAGLAFDAARSGTTITLTPTTLTQQTSTQLCFTASLLDAFGGAPGGIGVAFTVTGANPSNQSVDTNSAGQAQYCYVGTNTGTDTALASIGGATASGTVTWSTNAPNRAPVVYAGNNAAITLPSSANLYGVVSDDGLPLGGTLSITWTQVSGPGSVTFANSNQPVTTATFSSPGTYDLRLTANDSQLSSYADVTVTVSATPQNQAPVVNPGPNQTVNLPLSATLNGIVTDDGLPAGGKLSSQWIEVSGPLNSTPVVFANPASPYTTATFVQPGAYVLSLTGDDSQLQTTATITITVVSPNQPPLVSCPNYGSFTAQLPNNTISLNCTVTDDGLPQGSTVTQKWTQVSGPAVVTFATPTQPATQATFPVAGSYTLDLTANDTQLTSVQQVSVTVSPVNQPPVVTIASQYQYQTITLPTNTATVSATVTDDGQPVGGTLSQMWSQTSGPAAAIIATPSQTSTQVTFTTAGNYNFQIAASDTQLTTTAFATVVVNPANKAPVVFAGANQTLSLPSNTITLTGTIADPGVPTGVQVSTAWSEVSGPAAVTFSSPTSLSTQVTFSTAGTYDLRLSATNTGLTGTSDLTVTVYAAPQNQPPVVSAGPNLTTTAGSTIFIAGTATDDGLPTGSHLTIAWSQLSGPAVATISYPNQASTFANFPLPGVYVLQLSANDTQLTSTATVTITALSPVNQPPSVYAGSYPTLTLPSNTVTLNGQVSDDGLPNGTLLVAWTQVQGPAAVTFANANQASTQVTLPVAGVYQLRLTASDTQLTSYADTYVTVKPADSGPVISFSSNIPTTLYLPNATASLAANITLNTGGTLSVTWSEVAGPGPVTFDTPNAVVTNATFPVTGNYNIELLASDGTLTTTSTLSIFVRPAAAGGPEVALMIPQDGQLITAPINVVGTVASNSPNGGNQSMGWTLDYSLNTQDGASTQSWTTLFTGATFPGTSQTLAALDPTILLNGTYTLRLTATDSYGQTATTSTTFVVSKNAKPGDFTLSFTDLTVPVAGIPITITRTYDSRDHGFHDFGPAWSLGIANVRIEKNRNLGKNWSETGTTGQFPSYCVQTVQNAIVTVTFPNGTQYLFQAVATPQCQLIAPMTAATIGFVELPGGPGTAGATLVPADGGQVLFDNTVPGNVNLVDYNSQPYNPTVFVLTTREGYTYTINQTLGVTSMSDANGNSLTINANGILSSTGKSITFTRDSVNRISKITDPDGNTLQYNYTSTSTTSGVLDQFIDGSGNSTTFDYYSGTFLNSITDAQGIRVAAPQFDSTGHLSQIIDANGKTSVFTTNETAQTETITDRLGNPTTYSYDADGNILTMTDAIGNTTTYTYDSNDNKLSETNALGKTTSYTYDASSNRLSENDPLGNKTSYTYNGRGQVLTVTDPLGHATTNVYDSNGNLTSTTDANGKTTSTVYGSNGLPSSVTDANGKTTKFQYDGSGNLTQQTDALNNVTTYTYDANNNKLSQAVTRTVNGQPQTITTGYKYDASNRLIETDYADGTRTQVQYNSIGKQGATIDQLNRTTTYTYDTMGRLTTTTYSDNTTDTATFDAENDRLTSTDRAGHTTTYGYDADKRLTKTTYADNTFTQTNYDKAGRVSSTVDANGNSTAYGYDDAGRRTTLTDALSHVTTFTYDNNGNQTAVKDARQNTTQYQYDTLNRQIAVIYPDQTTSTTAYDALGRVTSKADQAGKVTAYGYDALGRLSSVTQDAVTGGLNLLTQYGYDEVGNRISQTDANNHTTTYAYDQLGRRIGRTLPAGQSESYTYDSAGNLKTKTDFNGKTTTYAYDSSNRLLSKTPDASFNAAPIGFTYFANGLRQTMADPSGTTTYTYNTRNRLTGKVTPSGTLNYTYDNAGDVLTIASSNTNGASLTYTYDTLNRLATVTDNRLLAQGATSGLTTYSYDAVGNLQNFVYPNAVTHAYTYDPLNRLTQMGASKSQSALSNYAYTLGVAGNRTSVAELSGRTVAYVYDSLYRLTTETVSADPHNKNGYINYTYDAVGNRKTLSATLPPAGGISYTYDADDRLGSDQYDADGNTINSGGIGNTYDFENHLITHGAVTVVYDGDGNRVSETVAGVTTNYLVDTVNPTGYAQVLDELQSGTVTRTYAYGLERISENQIISSAWTPSFYGYDGHGSVRQLTNSAGAVTDTYDYDAFGNLVNQTGSTPNNYLFAGEQYDSALGLYYNRARYLNTSTGRFWSMDTNEPFGGDPRALHKYLYASANPVDRVDPSGNQDYITTVQATAINVSMQAITVVSEEGVIEVVQAPAAVSAVQTALQWALTALVFLPLVVQTGDNPPKRHAGVLQVQGADIKESPPDPAVVTRSGYTFSNDTLSWSWSQPSPLGGVTALEMLSGFVNTYGLLNSQQKGIRKPAFVQASQFIVNAMTAGGTGPTTRSYNANYPRVPDARVDIEVKSGLAFVPGP